MGGKQREKKGTGRRRGREGKGRKWMAKGSRMGREDVVVSGGYRMFPLSSWISLCSFLFSFSALRNFLRRSEREGEEVRGRIHVELCKVLAQLFHEGSLRQAVLGEEMVEVKHK